MCLWYRYRWSLQGLEHQTTAMTMTRATMQAMEESGGDRRPAKIGRGRTVRRRTGDTGAGAALM